MTGPSYPGSPYESQTTMQLSNIDFSKFPVTDKNFMDNITRLNSFADYVSKYMLTMQQGIDQSSENTLQKVQGFATNLVQLFGNGQLLFGINLGNLQYYLPAVGALFGFNQTDPFPINLFDAAEQFFLGYVVPLDSFASTINTIVDSILEAVGISPEFISSVNSIVSAFGGLAISIEDFVNDVVNLLGVFGITSGEFGPFSELWGAVTDLFGGNSLQELTNIINPVLNGLAPWIQDIADFVNILDAVITDFGGGISNIKAISNLALMFTSIIDLFGSSSSNMLTNPSFATNANSWDITPMSDIPTGGGISAANFNPSWNGTVGDSAVGSLEFTGTGHSWTISEVHNVSSGDQVTASGNFMYSDLGSGATVTASIAEYTDAHPITGDYTLLRTTALNTVGLNGSNTNWTKLSSLSSYTVSSDADYIAMEFTVYMPNGGIIYLDDCNMINASGGSFDVTNAWTGIFEDILGPIGTMIGDLLAIPTSLLSNDNTENLLSNPTLAQNANDWTFNSPGVDFQPTWNDAEGYNSNGSISFSGDVNSWALSEQIPIQSAGPATGVCYYMYEAVGASASITLEFQEYDSNHNLLSVEGSTIIAVSDSDNTWTEISTNSSYEASSGAAYIALRPTVAMPNGGTVYFSDFSLTKGGGISSSLIPELYSMINGIISFLSGGSLNIGTSSDLIGLLDNIPLIGPLIEGLGGTGSGISGLVTSITALPSDIMNSLLSFLTGSPSIGGTIDDLTGALGNIPLIGPLIAELGGTGTGLGDLATSITNIPNNIILTLNTFLSGGDVSNSLLTNLESLLQNIPLIGPLIEGLGGSGTGIDGLVSTIQGLLGDVTGVISALTGGGGLLSGFVSSIPILGQLISAGGGSGNSLTDFIDLFTVGNISSTQPNLLPSPAFNPGDVVDNPDWSIDTTTTRSADGSGSLMVIADGVEKAIRSGTNPNDIIAVASDDELTASIYVINQGYIGVGSGAPILLQMAEFTATGLGDFVTLDTYTPTGDVAWPGHEMTNTYTPATGVVGIQLRLDVAPSAKAGIFHFDDANLSKTGTLPTSAISGLPDILSSFTNILMSSLATIASTISGIPIIGNTLAEILASFEGIVPTNVGGSLGTSSLSGDLQSIVDTLISAFTGIKVSGGSLAELHSAAQTLTNIAGQDVTVYVTATGTTPRPTWANWTDVILVGPGQGGEQGDVFGLNGAPGAPGIFNATTWALGTDYDSSITEFSFTAGPGGTADGGVGTAPVVTCAASPVATAGRTLTATPGNVAESVQFLGSIVGPGPNGGEPYAYNGQNYQGGGNQNQHGAAGLSPGGAGAGGNGALFEEGGPGAPAGCWFRFRANAVTDQSTGADTTPPANPTVTFLGATNSTITLIPSGGADS